MKLVALPRNSNPYQSLLYEQFERSGNAVRYAGELTPSHTLNLLLLPAELAACRLFGWRVLHVHWVFAFKLLGSDRIPELRKLAQAWFTVVLAVARLLGMQIVWTVHNVLPHERVFHDEIAARRRLANSSDVVFVHSPATLQSLEELGVRPARSEVVIHGPLKPGLDASALRRPGAGGPLLRLLFFGLVLEYKGVEDLICAIRAIPATAPVRLLIAGECRDFRLRSRLEQLAGGCHGRVELRFGRIPETELTALFEASDVVVLPFRRVTTSGSALLAMGYGRVVVLPRLPAFASLPADSVVFYDGSIDDLRRVIVDLAQWPAGRLGEVGARASAYVGTLSWADSARQMLAAIGSE